jgi:hypothetical protein
MTHTDYWIGLMRRLGMEVRSLSETPHMDQGEQTMRCRKCGYVRLTSGSERRYCPNGCGELRLGDNSKERN